MATESKSGAESGLPFEDPLQVPIDQMETIKMASDDPAEISLQSGKDDLGPTAQSSLEELMVYLQKGLNSFKGLNLNGFQQIYPVFLSILGAVITALILVIASNVLHSINHTAPKLHQANRQSKASDLLNAKYLTQLPKSVQ